MRLRALRKLEEIEIRKEFETLTAEKEEIEALLASETKRWRVVALEIEEIRRDFGGDTELGRRRTDIGEPPSAVVVPMEAMVEREPITVICSEKGWIRAMKGHLGPDANLKYKEGDGPGFIVKAETTDKILFFTSDGRFFTLKVTSCSAVVRHGSRHCV